MYVRELANYRFGNPAILDIIFTDVDDMVSEVVIGAPLGKSDNATLTFNYHCTSDASPVGTYNDHHIYDRGDYDLLYTCQARRQLGQQPG